MTDLAQMIHELVTAGNDDALIAATAMLEGEKQDRQRICRDCNCEFTVPKTLNGHKVYYCPDCRAERLRTKSGHYYEAHEWGGMIHMCHDTRK